MSNQFVVKELYQGYRKKDVLQSVTFCLEDGVCGLLGPNGAGKTTLFRSVSQLLKGNYEMVAINQIPIGAAAYPYQIGYLPQQFGAFRELQTRAMLEFFAAMKKIPKRNTAAEVTRVLALTHLEEQARCKVGALSGGMCRRLGIAQALLGDPPLLLLDEPTVGLDPEERLRFQGLLRELGKNHMVLLSTHIVQDVEQACDRVLILNNGRLCGDGTVAKWKAMGNGSLEEGYLCCIKQSEAE